MKLLPIVLCCLFLFFDLQLISGENLVKDFVGKLHEAGDKVKSGLHKISERVKSNVYNIIPHKDQKNDDNIGTSVYSDKGDVLIFATSTERTSTTVSNAGNMVFPTEEPEKTGSEPEKPSVSTAAPTTTQRSNGTDQKGKENFVGGCLSGYQRTADGRCMPVY